MDNAFFRTINTINLIRYRVLFCTIVCMIWSVSATSQVVNLPCQTEVDGTLGLDRKNWNGGSTAFHSEGSLHNFDLPTNSFGDCKSITNVDITFTINSIDISNLPADCPAPVDYYINISAGCPSLAPASCDVSNLIYENGGPLFSQTLNFTSPPEDFPFGEVLGVDIVPVMDVNCTNGQSALSSGSIVLDFNICVTITVSDELIDTPPDLGMDLSSCPNGATTLDPGSYTTYSWDPNGEITPTIDAGPGSYSVTVTDSNGCTGEDDITIFPFPDSGISFDPIMPNVCDNGTIPVSVNESYSSYMWSNSLSGQTVNLTTGSYDVTITDSNNCTAVNSITVVNVPPPNAGIDNFLDVCNDGTLYNLDQLLLAHDAGGTWMDDNGAGVDVNVNPLSVSFDNVIPGTYTFTYTVMGTTPCPPDDAVITIEVFGQNDAGTSAIEQLCPNPGNLDFYNLIGNPDMGGTWVDIDGASVDVNSNPFSVNFNGIPDGTYNFEYTLFANGPCDEESAVLTIIILEAADAGMDNAETVCEGAQFDLMTLINGANDTGVFIDTDASAALSGSIVNTTGLAGQSFNFGFIVGSPVSPCGTDEAIFTLNIESSLSAGDDGSDSVCIGGDIDLYDILENEDIGGSFNDVNSSGGLFGNILTTASITPGTYTYAYEVGDGVICPFDNSLVTITFFEDPSYSITQSELVICENSCEEIEITFDGAFPFSFPIEVYSSTTGNLLASSNYTINNDTFELTTCNIIGDIEFLNDTLNIINDSIWILTIPSLNDLNCSLGLVDNPDTLIITTVSNPFYQLDTTACITDTLMINGISLFDGNSTYMDTLAGQFCDSIVHITVEFTEGDTIILEPILCDGDSTMIQNVWYNATNPSGEINFVNPNGCDSLLLINVSFYPSADSILNLSLCTGDSITINGTVYNSTNPTGTEILLGQSSNGCDSTIEVSLQFTTDIMIDINNILCLDDSIVVDGQVFNATNPSGQVTLTGTGCDTIVNINLTFQDTKDTLINGSFCPDFSIVINNNTYDITNPSGTEIIPSPLQLGCDSIINLDLSFHEEADTLIQGTFCPGFSISVNNNVYDLNNPSGMETLLNASQFGCDSLVTIDLNFDAPAIESVVIDLCDNESIQINGSTYNASNLMGSDTIVGGSINGCDSIVNVSVLLIESFSNNSSASICEGDSIFLSGQWQFSTGTFTDTLSATNMCDSIIITNLTVTLCQVDVDLSVTNNICFGDTLGTIFILLNSEIPLPYSIRWVGLNLGVNEEVEVPTNQAELLIPNLISDNYEVSFLDADGNVIYQETIEIFDLSSEIMGTWTVVDSILCNDSLGTIEFMPMGGDSPYMYTWDPMSIGNTPIAENISEGIYNLTVTDMNGCSFDTTFTLIGSSQISAMISVINPSCGGENDGQISVSDINGGTAPYEIFVNSILLDSMSISSLEPDTYTIEIVDADNCSISFTEELTGPSSTNLVSYTEDYSIILGDSIMIDGMALDTLLTYEWTANDAISCLDCPEPIVSPSNTTMYTLVVNNADGCSQTVIINIEVEVPSTENVFPNIFSPNGDNTNDELIFLSQPGTIGMELSIFDRWGNKVYQNISADNQIIWDGTRNGSLMNPGVFVYSLLIRSADDEVEVIYGDVLLIR